MSDTPPSFAFSRAKPKTESEVTPASTRSSDPPQPSSGPVVQVGARRRRGPNKPKPEVAPSIKVDLAEAIAAAALLKEEDAPAFAAMVKLLNGQPAAARRRLVKALGRIFA